MTLVDGEMMDTKLKKRSAADLLATVSETSTTPMPVKEACDELLKICKGNDLKGSRGPGRLSRDRVIEWLRKDYGWTGRGHDALDSVCRRLGRRSYTTP
jgi:hypothetical protein